MKYFKTISFLLLMMLLDKIVCQIQWGQQHHNENSFHPRLYQGWSAWTSWSTCSRSCGGGIQRQFRSCRRNAHSTGSVRWQCSGLNKKYRLCNTRRCSAGNVNSRHFLCSSLGQRLYSGKKYTWLPWTQGNPCQLSCQAKGLSLWVRHSTKVTDGIDCSHSLPITSPSDAFDSTFWRSNTKNRRVCVDGRCLEVGCNDVVESRSIRDMCGVCGGDNSTCKLHEGRYRVQYMDLGFTDIVTLPPGTRKINITELSSSRNILAIRSTSGEFFLNGMADKGMFDPSNTYMIDNVPFVYKRPFDSNEGETILSEGPTRSELQILIFHQEENPGIHYQFISPIPHYNNIDISDESEGHINTNSQQLNHPYINGQQHSQRRPTFQAEPHHGNQVYSVMSLENELTLKTESGERIISKYGRNDDEDSNLDKKRYVVMRPLDSELANRVTWEDTGFGQCSQSCAAGIQVSIIRCIVNGTRESVDEAHCRGIKPKPRVKICNKKACPPYYFADEWSECSKTCGSGRRTRTVTCRQEFAGDFMTTVSFRKCKGLPKPTAHERCTVQECAHWKITSDWSDCSVNCGNGKRYRKVVCMAGDKQVVPDSNCPTTKPARYKPCTAGPCLTRWFISDWNQCSADCDRGFQRRNVFCINSAKRPRGCPRTLQPNSTRSCTRPSCGVSHEWFAGAWGSCSTDCGRGFQQRKVACLSILPNGTMIAQSGDDENLPCSLIERPAIQQACNTKECGSKWHYTPWSDCSKSCGGGKRTRLVQCLDAEGHFSSGCNLNTRPTNSELCNTVECEVYDSPTCVDTDIQRCRLILKSRFCSYPVYYRERCCRTCSKASPQVSVRYSKRGPRRPS